MGLTENDIRPEELAQGQKEAYQMDVERLLLRKHEFVEVPCPSCDKWQNVTEFTKYTLSYVRCVECWTLYVSPRPTVEILKDYYTHSENYAYWAKHIFPRSEESRKSIAKERAEKVGSLKWTPGTILEVGSGYGSFCEAMKEIFVDVVAIEPTPELAQSCRDKGIQVIEKPFEEVEGVTASVICAFEVIEHLFSPKDFLKKCHSLLTDKGVLVLSCPNIKGFDLSVLGKLSDTIDTEHLNYFHPDSILSLLKRCGFESVEISTPGKLDVELVNKYAGRLVLPLKNILIPELQDFLVKNNLSSHMMIVARKK